MSGEAHQNAERVDQRGRRPTAGKDHIRVHSCQTRTGLWGYRGRRFFSALQQSGHSSVTSLISKRTATHRMCVFNSFFSAAAFCLTSCCVWKHREEISSSEIYRPTPGDGDKHAVVQITQDPIPPLVEWFMWALTDTLDLKLCWVYAPREHKVQAWLLKCLWVATLKRIGVNERSGKQGKGEQ